MASRDGRCEPPLFRKLQLNTVPVQFGYDFAQPASIES